jgi:Fic family protein
MSVKRLDLTNAVPYHTGAFPPSILDWPVILPVLEDAAVALGRYDAKMSGLINSELLMAPLRKQDAVSSSRMEGTISTVTDIYRVEADQDGGVPDPFDDARDADIETALYALAMRDAERAMTDGRPLSEHLIRAMHQTLLSFGRGARKSPGAYKTAQNYIGDERTGVVQFIPVAPEHLPQGMAALVDFIRDGAFRPLIRTAIAHVEFEALHPFQDGNGRIGRMLITLMLWQFRILERPHFFLSGYFEDHKDEYLARKRAVSEQGDWSGWVAFFLTALRHQAQVSTDTADRLARLYADMRERFRVILNSQYHARALDEIFAAPVFRNDRFIERSDIPAATARILTRRLLDAGLLRELQPARGRRAALLAFDPLLDAVEI